MRTLKAKDFLQVLQIASQEDVKANKTGWAAFGAISCAYYPQSSTRNWFINGERVNRNEAKVWLTNVIKGSTKP